MITTSEFQQRRARARDLARSAGLNGLVVCSRGGGTVDRYGDVMYLTNHYSPFPFIPDLPGAWTGRSHSFLVLPVDGDPVLVTDTPYVDAASLPADQIVVTDLVTEGLIAALKRTNLDRAQVGLAGGDTLPYTMGQALETAAPTMTLTPADGILTSLRAVKSEGEINKLQHAASVGSRMIEAMMEVATPGATHGAVVAAGSQVLIEQGGQLYNSFMASGRGGDPASIVRSNFPTWASASPLREGMWLRLGLSGVVGGYCFDVSRSRAIGEPSDEQIEVFEAAIAVVHSGIGAMRPGVTGGSVARAGMAKEAELGFSQTGVFAGLGHGIGLGWDSPWLVAEDETPITANMVINVEKTLMRDSYLGDFEETVLVTPDGPRILTDARHRFW